MDFVSPASTSFAVTSKPLLPLDAELRSSRESLAEKPEPQPRQPLLRGDFYHPSHHYTTPEPFEGRDNRQGAMANILHGWSDCGTISNPHDGLGSSPPPPSATYPDSVPESLQPNEKPLDSSTYASRVPPTGRQRTAQACEKCRDRKTKCSGARPVCDRCASRGLICIYKAGRELRFRGPSKARHQSSMSALNTRYAEGDKREGISATIQASQRVSVSQPSSRSSSPAFGTLPRASHTPFRSSVHWTGTGEVAPSHVSFHSPSKTPGANSESNSGFYGADICDLTPRPNAQRNAETSMFDEYLQVPQSAFAFNLDYLWDYTIDGNSSGSERPSSNTSQISLAASADSNSSHRNSYVELQPLSSDSRFTAVNLNRPASSASSSNASSPPSFDFNQDFDVTGQDQMFGLPLVDGAVDSHSESSSLHYPDLTFLADLNFLDSTGGSSAGPAETSEIHSESGGTLSHSVSLTDEIKQFFAGGHFDYSGAQVVENIPESTS